MEKNGRTWELYPSFLHIFSNTASLADWKEIWTSTATEVTRGKLDSHKLVCTPSHTAPVFQLLNKAWHYLSRNDTTLHLCIFNHALANPALGLASKDQSSQQDPMLMNLKWNACRTDLSFKIACNACAFDMEQVKNRPILHTTAGFHDLQFGCNLGLTALHNRI
jgi:hypothetical protein